MGLVKHGMKGSKEYSSWDYLLSRLWNCETFLV